MLQVKKVITHPDFEARTFKNDLGDQLLSLKANFYSLSLLNAIAQIHFFLSNFEAGTRVQRAHLQTNHPHGGTGAQCKAR